MNPSLLSIETLSERTIAKTIDHSLLRPELDDQFVEDGCKLAAGYNVASVCVRPVDVRRAAALLAGTDVAVGATVGFPHGNHLTDTKVAEARTARRMADASEYSMPRPSAYVSNFSASTVTNCSGFFTRSRRSSVGQG